MQHASPRRRVVWLPTSVLGVLRFPSLATGLWYIESEAVAGIRAYLALDRRSIEEPAMSYAGFLSL